MRNVLIYPHPVVRDLLDKTVVYRAARYYAVSRQVTPEWSTLSKTWKAKHFVAVYRFIKGK